MQRFNSTLRRSLPTPRVAARKPFAMQYMSSSMRRAISPVLLLVVWELASRTGLLDPHFVPPPSVVLTELGRMIVSGELLTDLWASLRRILMGFAISVVVSVLIGALMARMSLVEDLLDPIIELIRPVSPLAIYPLAILWFGLDDASKVFIIALSCSFPVILNTYAGVREINQSYIQVARSLGASSVEIFFKVVLKGAMPQIFTGVRLAWGISLIVIIAAEMVGGTGGLGYMVLNAQQTFRVDQVFAGIIIIGALGYGTDFLFRRLCHKLMPWHQQFRGR